MIRTARAWSANRIEREAALIRQPTMIVWGDRDDHFPLANAFRLRDAIPNSKLIVFRNCGHLPPAEHPAKFVEVVSEFCSPKSVPTAVAGG
jgi:4,5:9,10-diseco-3-hydroxy-5,9,17-trioxoandrosta-1(10),2-diene-4-oate hydrolase